MSARTFFFTFFGSVTLSPLSVVRNGTADVKMKSENLINFNKVTTYLHNLLMLPFKRDQRLWREQQIKKYALCLFWSNLTLSLKSLQFKRGLIRTPRAAPIIYNTDVSTLPIPDLSRRPADKQSDFSSAQRVATCLYQVNILLFVRARRCLSSAPCFYLYSLHCWVQRGTSTQSHLRSINTPHLFFIYFTPGKSRQASPLANGFLTMRLTGHQSYVERALKCSH